MSFVPYHEPSITQVLVLSSFLYLLNVARSVFDTVIYAGLVGEIAVGIIYGAPLGAILEPEWQESFLAIGYVGLLLIVFEGGFSTPLGVLTRSLPIATCIGLLGIGAPIALSFLLLPIGGYSSLEAFAAGASLSSTSLGTTFFVLKSLSDRNSDGVSLEATRLGTILAGAAIFDDIIGFVLLSVIQTLGKVSPGYDVDPWGIARPLVVSIIFATISPLVAKFILCPIFRKFVQPHLSHSRYGISLGVFVMAVTLLASITICTYIGSSMLLGAYTAGLIAAALPSPSFPAQNPLRTLWDHYIESINVYVLSPIFFASIGTAIPFLSLWDGAVVWRGVLYALLMFLSKVICGLVLLSWGWVTKKGRTKELVRKEEQGIEMHADGGKGINGHAGGGAGGGGQSASKSGDEKEITAESTPGQTNGSTENAPTPQLRDAVEYSLIPSALFIGLALVARGEIGLLISQIAYNQAGLLGEEAFIVTTWAVILNTIIGPIFVGLLVKRLGPRVVAGRWA